MTENISNLAAALVKAQGQIGSALKNASNPYFKSRYADLTCVIDAVKGPLNSNGIAFLQAVGMNDGQPVVTTILLHESGESLETVTPVYCAKPNDPQAFGSGVTYSKRYALQALLGLPTEDDDAEKAMDRNTKSTAAPKPSIDLKALQSDAGLEFLSQYSAPQEALSDLRKSKEVSLEAEAAITALFESGAVHGDGVRGE